MSSKKITTKTCHECTLQKPVSQFRKDPTYKDGYYYKCIDCEQAANRAYQRERAKRAEKRKGLAVRHKRLAKLFAFWMSIPATVKDAKYFEKVKNVEITEEIETLMPKLLEAVTLKDVAKVLGVKPALLTKWSKNPSVLRMVDKFDTQNNLMRFKRDIDYNFTQATIKHSDAARVKLWYQIHMGWVEKTASTLEAPRETTEDIQKSLRQLAEKRDTSGFSAGELQKAIVAAKKEKA